MTDPYSRHRQRRRTWLGIVTAVALGVAACGDSDDATADETAATSATAGTEPSGAGPAGTDTTAFCDARIQLELAFSDAEPDVELITTLLGDLEASAPSDLTANAAGLATALATAAESGTDPTDDPAFGENIGPIDDFALTDCGYPTVETIGVDYAFDGVPETIPAGITGFRFANEGAEPHEIVLFRLDDSVTDPVVDLFMGPEEELEGDLMFVGAAFAESGESAATFTDLTPGRYAAVCFIPVGGGEDGPPHFMEGMIAEFEVT